MKKLDLTKEDPTYYKVGKTPSVVEIDPHPFLVTSGMGAPEDEAYQKSIQALYGTGYGIKFLFKEADKDFVVPKLETYWWVESGLPFNETPRDQWYWRLAMRMPDFIDPASAAHAIQNEIGKGENPYAVNLAFHEIHQGKCVHALHVGPYEKEKATIEKLIQFAEDEKLAIQGQHHEIYLSDPTRAKPENLKTIIRYSVQ